MSRVSADAIPTDVGGGSASPTLSASRAGIADVKPSQRTSLRRKLMVGAGLLVALGGGAYRYATLGIEATDNAQVDADLVAVPARASGVVAFVYFEENQRVSAGTPLAQLDRAPFEARLAETQASLAAAEASAQAALADAELARAQALGNRDVARANLQTNTMGERASSDEIRQGEAQVETARARLLQAKLDLSRAQALFESGAFTRAQLDSAQTAQQLTTSALAAETARLSALRLAKTQSQSRVVEASARLRVSDQVETLIRQAEARAAVARAQVDTARAARDLAAIDLSYTKIVAPSDGVVSKKSVNPGQAVAAGQSIVQLVPKQRWITANFKETQLAHMRAGQAAHFTLDAYPGVELEGDVQSLSGATGARFTLLPPDNATGNFTKVVQRVPVRIRVHEVPKNVELRPGMSVELRVDTNHG